MNTSLTAYTHLESLLLFQSLHAHGLGPHVFSSISELLKTNPHITADKRFQSGRLSPDALRNFYLHILKEELASEQAAADADAAPNGDVKPSRKRKAPSPSLPTVQESIQHQHLIPKLVDKLYARYRAALTDQIRHDEERYDTLQRELQGIERGDWDHQLKEKANAKSASRSPSLSKKSPLLPQQSPPSNANSQSELSDGVRGHTPAQSSQQQGTLEAPAARVSRNGSISGDKDSKTIPKTSPRKKQTPAEQRGRPSTPQAHPPSAPSQRSTLTPQPIAPPPTYSPQQSQPSPYAPPAHPQKGAPAANSHPSAGTSSGPHIQPHPIQPFIPNGAPQFGSMSAAALPQFSPTPPFLASHPPGPQSPSVQTPQQQRGYGPYPGQPPYPVQQHNNQPPSQGGFMLPPFQVSPQDPSRAHQLSTHPQLSTPVSVRQSSAKTTPYSSARPGFPPMHPLVTHARSSFSTPSGVRTPQSAVSTPRSAKTIWKASARSFGTPPAPRPEVSPIDDIDPSEPLQQSPPKSKASRRSRTKKNKREPEKEQETDGQQELEQAEEPVPELETRQGRTRRRAATKSSGTRLGSIASSQAGTSVRDRSRSQSILSHTETVAADNDSQVDGRIKSERGTSMEIVEEDTAATATHMSTRSRGGALQSRHASNKRKRNAREVSPEEPEEHLTLPELPKTVIAPRHFSRMCTPLMNDIGSHKHASTFTTAVKAKDAEGYYDIIKRPTDLKTIQKAIAAGAKQVAAAASGDTPIGSPGGGGAIIELPLTLDNIPPKAVVNSSQLEKELMRMFVNAVMFNAGEEGVVEDARQMFETVQQSVSSWRSVERSSGKLEAEETPPVQEEEAPTASKRRKL